MKKPNSKKMKLVILDETYNKVRPLYNPDDEKFKRINYRIVKRKSV